MPVFRKAWRFYFCCLNGPITAPNKLIAIQHCKRHTRKRTSKFHSRLRFILTITQSKPSFLKNFKLLQTDLKTGRTFSKLSLISFKRGKNIGNFPFRIAFLANEQPGTFKCARPRCKTCPIIRNVEKSLGPKRSVKMTDRFACISANVICCITCTYCKKLYMGETGRR